MQKEYQDYINKAKDVEKEVFKFRLETPQWQYLKTHVSINMKDSQNQHSTIKLY